MKIISSKFLPPYKMHHTKINLTAMKNVLLGALSLTLMAFGSWANTAKDSVIVNYGSRTRIVLHAETISGNDLLKEVDGIIKDLRLSENSKDTTLVLTRQGGNIKVLVRNNAPEKTSESAIVTNRWNENERGDRRYSRSRDKWWDDDEFEDFLEDLDVRIPIYLGGMAYGESPNDMMMGLNSWRSRDFMFGIHGMSGRRGNRTSLEYGLEYANNSLNFSQNPIIIQGADRVSFMQPSGIQIERSRLSVTYLQVPLLIRNRFRKGFFKYISVGGYAGVRVGTNTILESNRPDREVYEYTHYYVNNFRYGARVELGIRKFLSFYGQYDISTLFETNRGPKVNLVSFGIRIF
jgi:hypothetical protein